MKSNNINSGAGASLGGSGARCANIINAAGRTYQNNHGASLAPSALRSSIVANKIIAGAASLAARARAAPYHSGMRASSPGENRRRNINNSMTAAARQRRKAAAAMASPRGGGMARGWRHRLENEAKYGVAQRECGIGSISGNIRMGSSRLAIMAAAYVSHRRRRRRGESGGSENGSAYTRHQCCGGMLWRRSDGCWRENGEKRIGAAEAKLAPSRRQ